CKAERGRRKPEPCGSTQRRRGESDVARERQAHQLSQGILGLAGMPASSLVFDPELFEAHPASQTPEETIPLPDRNERGDYAPVQQAEVSGIEGDVDLGDNFHRAVKNCIGRTLQNVLL